jgi:hypothetical protein
MDFMVGLKARYHGGTIPIVGVPWSQALKGVLSSVSHVLNKPMNGLAAEAKEKSAPTDECAVPKEATS